MFVDGYWYFHTTSVCDKFPMRAFDKIREIEREIEGDMIEVPVKNVVRQGGERAKAYCERAAGVILDGRLRITEKPETGGSASLAGIERGWDLVSIDGHRVGTKRELGMPIRAVLRRGDVRREAGIEGEDHFYMQFECPLERRKEGMPIFAPFADRACEVAEGLVERARDWSDRANCRAAAWWLPATPMGVETDTGLVRGKHAGKQELLEMAYHTLRQSAQPDCIWILELGDSDVTRWNCARTAFGPAHKTIRRHVSFIVIIRTEDFPVPIVAMRMERGVTRQGELRVEEYVIDDPEISGWEAPLPCSAELQKISALPVETEECLMIYPIGERNRIACLQQLTGCQMSMSDFDTVGMSTRAGRMSCRVTVPWNQLRQVVLDDMIRQNVFIWPWRTYCELPSYTVAWIREHEAGQGRGQTPAERLLQYVGTTPFAKLAAGDADFPRYGNMVLPFMHWCIVIATKRDIREVLSAFPGQNKVKVTRDSTGERVWPDHFKDSRSEKSHQSASSQGDTAGVGDMEAEAAAPRPQLPEVVQITRPTAGGPDEKWGLPGGLALQMTARSADLNLATLYMQQLAVASWADHKLRRGRFHTIVGEVPLMVGYALHETVVDFGNERIRLQSHTSKQQRESIKRFSKWDRQQGGWLEGADTDTKRILREAATQWTWKTMGADWPAWMPPPPRPRSPPHRGETAGDGGGEKDDKQAFAQTPRRTDGGTPPADTGASASAAAAAAGPNPNADPQAVKRSRRRLRERDTDRPKTTSRSRKRSPSRQRGEPVKKGAKGAKDEQIAI